MVVDDPADNKKEAPDVADHDVLVVEYPEAARAFNEHGEPLPEILRLGSAASSSSFERPVRAVSRPSALALGGARCCSAHVRSGVMEKNAEDGEVVYVRLSGECPGFRTVVLMSNTLQYVDLAPLTKF